MRSKSNFLRNVPRNIADRTDLTSAELCRGGQLARALQRRRAEAPGVTDALGLIAFPEPPLPPLRLKR